MSIKLLPAASSFNSFALVGLLCLSLLFVVGVDLNHSHDGDVQTRFDCEICLKVGSLEELTLAGDVSLAAIIRTPMLEAAVFSLPFLAGPSPTARAPPAVS